MKIMSQYECGLCSRFEILPSSHEHRQLNYRIQWHKSPGWPSSKTRVLDFQFPNDNLSLLENSVFSCQIQGVKYLLPSFSKKIFTKHVPDVIGFLNLFRRCNKATESITGDVEKQAFGHYVHSYFPHADSSTTSRLLNQVSLCLNMLCEN